MIGDELKEADAPVKVEPGNIVLLSEFGCRSYTTFPGLLTYTEGDLQLSAASEIHLIYKDVEAFKKAVEALNNEAI